MWYIPFLILGLLLAGPILEPSPSALAQAPNDRFTELDGRWAGGAMEETRAALAAMDRRHPEDPEILWRLSWVKTDIGREMEMGSPQQRTIYREALAHAERAVTLAGDHPQAHLTLALAAGHLAYVSGTSDRVRYSRVVQDHVERSIELNPFSDIAFMVRGLWSLEVSRLGFFTRAIVRVVYGGLPEASKAQAVEDFQRAVELHDRVIHRVNLGRALMEMGRAEQAERELRTALAMPEDGLGTEAHRQQARDLLDALISQQ